MSNRFSEHPSRPETNINSVRHLAWHLGSPVARFHYVISRTMIGSLH